MAKKGAKYKCEECGLVVVVDETCGCAECDLQIVQILGHSEFSYNRILDLNQSFM